MNYDSFNVVNQISRKLLTFQPQDDFGELVQDCLCLLGETLHKNRIFIWKDRTYPSGEVRCTQIYEWVRGVMPIQGNAQFEEISYEDLPAFADAINNDRCLNSLIRDLSASERTILEPQNIQTILIAPIAIAGVRWGFIGVDNCENEQLFNHTEENMLLISGSMLAHTIQKMEIDHALHETEEHSQLLLDAMPLCCNLWTQDNQNMRCNDEAVRLFELSSQQEYLELFPKLSPEYQPCGRHSGDLAAEYISIAFQEGYFRFEWMHQKIDGTPIPAEVTLVRIKYKDTFIVAGYTRDLREQKEMLGTLQSKEDDLRSARDDALLNSQAKSNFLANMSHEIRTPMNAISGLTEIILRENTDGNITEYAQGIKNAASNLLNIINDILDISKIESGKLEIYNSEYELASLLHDVIAISRMRLGGKHLMFITDIDCNLPARLWGDEVRIKQILINLLSNAIKFTPEGFIALRVSGVVVDNEVMLRFSVTDSGMGIKDEDLILLFAEFERVNTTKNRNIEGTGLGLAISKHLCDMMHGRIEVNSTFQQGSEFIATIPQECTDYEPLAQVRNTKNILLYEPRELYRLSITETLENLNCTCVPCSNQSDLYDNIHAKKYDFILTAALHLKKVQLIVEKNNLKASLVAFTDYGETTGTDNVYTILFPVNCLQIANLLNGQHEFGGSSRYAKAIANFTAPSAHILVVDDNPVNLQVAKGLMKPYEFTIDTATNGIEALDLIMQVQYDLVFMDHMMPEMDGIDATVAIRQMEGKYYKNLPIIALTANALVGTKELFIREGMNDFLAKPIEINKLGQVLSRWLPESKKLTDTGAKKVESNTDYVTWEISGVNTTQGILSVGGSEENYLQILATYHTDGTQKCTSLLQHLTNKKLVDFRTEIHALKSTSATIGALEISTMAASLESAAQNNDITFIDSNMDDFLTRFKMLLDAIHPVLPSTVSMPVASSNDEGGDVTYLQEALDSLYDAAEFANIAQIESIMKNLQHFAWAENIQPELLRINECLLMFDYDEILACVLRLKQILT